MESYKLVLPEHLNHYGYLFGGNLLKWVDEVSWIAASRDHPGCRFVTVAMDRVEFHHPIREGSILRISALEGARGRTSTRYAVEVFCDDLDSGREAPVFTTHVSFVCLDEQGAKCPIPEEPSVAQG
ncbi:acyl-CoA thioesterase [Endothiovibrio diazotrophicus]